MDEMSSKALNIGVALLITISIVSGIFFVINQIKAIYQEVYVTDISIQNSFSEFDQYDNTEKTGIDVLNAVKKYLDSNLVEIYIGDVKSNVSTSAFYKNNKGYNIQNLTSLGKEKYKSTLSQNESTGRVKITFTKE